MNTTRISDYRNNLSSFHTRVLDDHEPLLVTGSSRGDLIVIPFEDFERLQESINVLKDRATMNSLLEGRAEYPAEDTRTPEMKDVFTDAMDSKNK